MTDDELRGQTDVFRRRLAGMNFAGIDHDYAARRSHVVVAPVVKALRALLNDANGKPFVDVPGK